MWFRIAPLLLVVSCSKNPSLLENSAETAPLEDPLDVRIVKLENGLTVYLSENHEEPIIAARTVVRAGGAQDDPMATGMAHYLEHMLANKGTTKLGTTNYEAEKPLLDEIQSTYDKLFDETDPEERAALYARIDELGQQANEYTIANELKQAFGVLGGRGFNAFTSRDQTAYVVDVPSNKLEPWAILEGDRFTSPVFRSFQTEVETVYEEKNRAMDNAQRQLYDAMSAALFGDHPYGRSVLGTVDHLKNPSISRMQAFYDKWYVPGNMAVVLAGDFDSDEALQLIERHLGGLEVKPVPDEPLEAPDALAGEVEVTVQHNADEEVQLAWQTVARNHPDAAALTLADMLLDNSASGILDRNLNNTEKVRASGSSAETMRYSGYQKVWARPREGQKLSEVKELLLAEMDKVKNGEFSDEELDAIRLNFRVRETAALESNGARVRMMMNSFVFGEEWSYTLGMLDRYDEVSREDIQRVASQYWGDNRVVVNLVSGQPDIPKIEAPPLGDRPVNASAHSELFEQVVALDTPELEAQVLLEGKDYRSIQTKAGRLYTVENPFSDLSSVQFRFENGSKRDPLLCIATNLWRRAGVGELDQSGWEDWLYNRAVSVNVNCSDEAVLLTISGPSDQLLEALPLVRQKLVEPVMNPERSQAYLTDYVARRQDNKISAELQQNALRKYAIYGENSPMLEAATDEVILGTSLEDYVQKIRFMENSERTMIYVGPLSIESVEQQLVSDDVEYVAAEPFPPRTLVTPDESRILLLDYDSVQSKITVYGPDTVFDSDDAHLYALYSEMMGGSAGVVFQEIREARSLAYSASGGYQSGAETGDQNFVWGVLACQADKTNVATELLVDLLHNLPEQAERWERIHTSAIQRQMSSRIGFRAVGGAVESWLRQGLAEDPRAGLVKGLEEATFDDLKTFSNRFRELPFTIVILGDLDRLDREALEALAPVTEVRLEDLISY